MRANVHLDRYRYKSGNQRNHRELLLAAYPNLKNLGVQIGTEDVSWDRLQNLLIDRAELIDTLVWLEALDLDRLAVALEIKLHLIFKNPIFNCKIQQESVFSKQRELFAKLTSTPAVRLLLPTNDKTIIIEIDNQQNPYKNKTQKPTSKKMMLLILGEYQNHSNDRRVENRISQASLKTTITNKTTDLELILGGPIDSLELIFN